MIPSAESPPRFEDIDDLPDPSATLVVRARWYSQSDAARILGISEVALRKRIASGELSSIRAGRGRRVLLLGEQPPDRPTADDSHPTEPEQSSEPSDEVTPRQDLQVLARTSESLVTLVRDLQRQGLALAGQIGYLQNQLAQAQERVNLLEQTASAPVAQNGVSREEHDRVLQEVATLTEKLGAAEPRTAPARRRWRFWRR